MGYARSRHCPTCQRGFFLPEGRAFDGRPAYVCSCCGQTHTCGKNGYEWDGRPGREDWNREKGLKAWPGDEGIQDNGLTEDEESIARYHALGIRPPSEAEFTEFLRDLGLET